MDRLKGHPFTSHGAIPLLLTLFLVSGCPEQRTDKVPVPANASSSNTVAHQADSAPFSTTSDRAAVLPGTFGRSPEWHSAWLDFPAPRNFRQGDRVELTVAGPAAQIVVRFLEQGVSADSPTGIVGGATAVPPSGVVVLQLARDYTNIRQISVHAGPNPWGLFPLGQGNGDAALQGARVFQ